LLSEPTFLESLFRRLDNAILKIGLDALGHKVVEEVPLLVSPLVEKELFEIIGVIPMMFVAHSSASSGSSVFPSWSFYQKKSEVLTGKTIS